MDRMNTATTLTIYANGGMTIIARDQINHVAIEVKNGIAEVIISYSHANLTIIALRKITKDQDLIILKNQVQGLLANESPMVFEDINNVPRNPIYSNPGESFNGYDMDLSEDF